MSTEILEDYLAGDFHLDMGDIAQLEQALERTANMFVLAQNDEGIWPYAYRQSAGRPARSTLSHGTQAMIAAALSRMVGSGRLASGRPARLALATRKSVQKSYDLGVAALVDQLDGTLKSGSFGINDPVTLSHFADLLAAMPDTSAERVILIEKIGNAISELVEVAQFDPRSALSSNGEQDSEKMLLRNLPEVKSILAGEEASKVVGKPPRPLMNAFVPLRIARSIVALGKVARTLRPVGFEQNYRRFFESTLHEQLSYSDIPDSRFDPAELIFCLEGLMVIAPNAVDDRLFDRVLTVLGAKQDESAHWRPSRPIYATDQGMTMLPVSVEGAVSLMRSIAIRDRNQDFQPLSVRAVPMARRFWKWLQARAVRFVDDFDGAPAVKPTTEKPSDGEVERDRRQVTGWHSEHVNDPGLVHLWDTSQVAEFMLAYRELLQRAVAGRTLQLSGLKINRPAQDAPADPVKIWEKVVAGYEPCQGIDPGKQVYARIGAAFVDPWSRDVERKPSSMMLYGPPGTGKSTVGDNLATTLGMRMITVTVSDFLGRGGAYVEARAKAIFQTLEAQFDSIILFDEIDTFLLDRDSARYDKQDTLFQFLTPGMLTKINDLHKLGRSIFIIATNYKNRIDPAIQRKGRIDQHYLLGLPNKAQREAILCRETSIKKGDADLQNFASDTVFFGFPDMKAAIDDAGGKQAKLSAIATELSSADRRPATVTSYLRRIVIKDGRKLDFSDFPFDEFEGLLELYQEVREGDVLADMVNHFGTDFEADQRIEIVTRIKPKPEAQGA